MAGHHKVVGMFLVVVCLPVSDRVMKYLHEFIRCVAITLHSSRSHAHIYVLIKGLDSCHLISPALVKKMLILRLDAGVQLVIHLVELW